VKLKMNASRWWTVALLVLTVAGAVWLARSIEWVDVEQMRPARNEAARDRFYAAKSLVRRLGGHVAAPLGLDVLPPPGATLLLSSSHWDMFPGRDAALRRWVENGGRLVIAEMPFFREQFVPQWAPLRNVPDNATAAASSPGSGERGRSEPCRLLSEPDAARAAFGLARSFRVCGVAVTHLEHRLAPQWLVADRSGTRMARVGVGHGSVTASTMHGSFANEGIVGDDGALAFVAALDLHAGDAVWFVDDETRAPLLRALASAGLPALLLGAAALLLALWRAGPRFGPIAAEPAAARRSIGEQIRRTAAFIAGGDGAALHRASLLALEAAAGRVIADFAALPTLAARAAAITRLAGGEAAALAAAMRPPKRRRTLAATIAELERARRSLLPDARQARSRHALQAPTS
jgi:uncharacterized protein DUF4350